MSTNQLNYNPPPQKKKKKIHENIQNTKWYLYNTSLVFGLSDKLYLAQNLELWYPSPDFTLPDEQIPNVITCVEKGIASWISNNGLTGVLFHAVTNFY